MRKKKNSPAASLARLGERRFLKRLLPQLVRLGSHRFFVPPGDDAAVLKGRGVPVLTIDGLTENTHFRLRWEKTCRKFGFSLARALGWKMMGASLSDLAAMGENANRWAMIYLGAPGKTPVSFLNEFDRGVREAARRFDCALAGGDTVRAETISLVAAVGAERVGSRSLVRSGARAGDLIGVAGTVGDAAVGLKILEGQLRATPAAARFFVKRFFDHRPLFNEGRALARERGVTALLDLSDSFRESVELLGEASKVGVRVNIDRIPVSSLYRRTVGISPELLTGGEDYGLLFTFKPAALSALKKKMRFAVVGEITPRNEGIRFFNQGRAFTAPKAFQHFA